MADPSFLYKVFFVICLCLLRLVIGITGYYQATVHNQHETCHANKKCSEHYHHLHHIKIYG